MLPRIPAIALAISLTSCATIAQSQTPADLTDPEIAHVAYVADEIDIRYGHLALAMSEDPAVREFASTMIRDHGAINEQALALLQKLGVAPQDNFLSQKLNADGKKLVDEMSQLRGAEFDKRYAENELAYHEAVVALVGEQFIPNIDTPEVKVFFEQGLEIFKQHAEHARMMVKKLGS